MSSYKSFKWPILSTVLLLVCAGAQAGGDPVVGEQKAQVCAACHGATGVSAYEQTQAPIIAGQYADYMVRTLKDYKSGKRENPIMAGMVANLSEQDMEDIAAHYARQDGLAAPEITNPVSQ